MKHVMFIFCVLYINFYFSFLSLSLIDMSLEEHLTEVNVENVELFHISTA